MVLHQSYVKYDITPSNANDSPFMKYVIKYSNFRVRAQEIVTLETTFNNGHVQQTYQIHENITMQIYFFIIN